MAPDGPARAEFEATYGAMLGGFWRYAAGARGKAWAALRRETLACAVAALRARQARVLPRFAAAEDAERLAEVMSFPLAACVVVERFAAVAGRAAALGWLGQEPAALRALAAYFGDGPSELRAIAEEAECRIGLALDRGPVVPAPCWRKRPRQTSRRPATTGRAAEPEPAPERTPPPVIGGEGAGWEWVNWVWAGLRDGSVPVNAVGA